MSGAGKVFKGAEFIVDVHYDYHVTQNFDQGALLDGGSYSVRIPDTSYLRIKPGIGVSADRFTLHMSDGRKQDFYTESSDGTCRATGGLY